MRSYEIFQRPVARLARQPDHRTERIIGLPRDGKQHLPRPQQSEQCDRQRMGAGHKIVPHERILRPQHLRPHTVKDIPPEIAVAIPRACAEARLTDPVVGKTAQHLGGIVCGDLLNAFKDRCACPLRLGTDGSEPGIYRKEINHSHCQAFLSFRLPSRHARGHIPSGWA